jgi:hypothetical protein
LPNLVIKIAIMDRVGDEILSQEEPPMSYLQRLFNGFSRRAQPIAQFERMLDWKLLRGSHEFPGTDGGTCVNEAALVAAGYPYRAVYSVQDLPASFSRPIAMLALCLNDTVEDDQRQKLLLPFVTRLAGSADTEAVEMDRARIILEHTIFDILLPALKQTDHANAVERCYGSGSAGLSLAALARALRSLSRSELSRPLASACEHAFNAAAQLEACRPTEVVFCAFLTMREIAGLERQGGAAVYDQAAGILSTALQIGRRANEEMEGVIVKRMQEARRRPVPRRRAGSTLQQIS